MIVNAKKLLPLIVGIHLVSIPLYLELPAPVLILIALFTFWAVLVSQQRVKQPGWLLRLLLSAVMLIVLLFTYGTVLGQQPGSAMLILLSYLKLFEMKDKRDVAIVIFIGYFVIASSFFHTQSPVIAVYVFVVVIYLTSVLVIFSDRLGSINLKSRLRLSARLIMQAVPLMLILFVLFPRIPGPLWGLPKDAQISTTGVGEEMTPGSINSLISSGAVAFRARFKNEIPQRSDLYWRGLVLSDYDGTTWRQDNAPSRMVPNLIHSNNDLVRYTITLEPHNRKWLYALEQLVEFGDELEVGRELQLFASKKINNVFSYSAGSDLFAENKSLFQAERKKNLELPAQLNKRTLDLAQQFRQKAGENDAELVYLVLQYFREQEFYYTLSPPLLGMNAMDDFLFNTRRGFCEHYSSSFVYLMRAAGIPARVVIGYQGGEMNPVDDYMIVRQSDAHAWTEVWLNNKWLRMDPTAAVSPDRIEYGVGSAGLEPGLLPAFMLSENALLQRARYALDSFHNAWNQWVVGFNQKKQRELFSNLGFDNIDSATLITWLVAAMTLAGGLVFWWVIRGDPHARSDKIRRYYEVFCSKLAKAGLQKKPYEGAHEFLARVVQLFPALTKAATMITNDYQYLRYSSHSNELRRKNFMRQVNNFHIRP